MICRMRLELPADGSNRLPLIGRIMCARARKLYSTHTLYKRGSVRSVLVTRCRASVTFVLTGRVTPQNSSQHTRLSSLRVLTPPQRWPQNSRPPTRPEAEVPSASPACQGNGLAALLADNVRHDAPFLLRESPKRLLTRDHAGRCHLVDEIGKGSRQARAVFAPSSPWRYRRQHRRSEHAWSFRP